MSELAPKNEDEVSEAAPAQPAQPAQPTQPADADSDPDFDDLDDVLDQFSSSTAPPKAPSQPTPTASGPGRPEDVTTASKPSETFSPPIPEGQRHDESSDAFLARLTSEMQTMMSSISTDPAASNASPDDIAKMGEELDSLTRKLEAEGIKPQDLLKAILGEETGTQVARDAENERDRRESQSSPQPSTSSKPNTFEETIRKTMQRIETSDTKATNASIEDERPKTEEEMFAELLKSLDTSGGVDGEGDLSKMFLGMMEQLTHKDMLYDPMKELDNKYPEWLERNKSKLSLEDSKRFAAQRGIVREIVGKFEEKGYSDDNPGCREYIWERMQKMQAEGAPPDDLIQNPFPGMGMPDLGAMRGGGEDPGCPTQ